MTHLHDATDEQLLAQLLKNKSLDRGPTHRGPPPLEALIGIGNDHTAYLGIYPESLEALRAITEDQADSPEVSPEVVPEKMEVTGQAANSNGQVISLQSVKSTNVDKRQATLLEMADHLRTEIESGRIVSIALVAEAGNGDIYSDYYGGFNATLIGGVANLQYRMLSN